MLLLIVVVDGGDGGGAWRTLWTKPTLLVGHGPHDIYLHLVFYDNDPQLLKLSLTNLLPKAHKFLYTYYLVQFEVPTSKWQCIDGLANFYQHIHVNTCTSFSVIPVYVIPMVFILLSLPIYLYSRFVIISSLFCLFFLGCLHCLKSCYVIIEHLYPQGWNFTKQGLNCMIHTVGHTTTSKNVLAGTAWYGQYGLFWSPNFFYVFYSSIF